MKSMLLAFALLLLLSSCGNNSSGPSTQSNEDYYPLSIGNEWVYSNHTKDSANGQLIDLPDDIRRIVGTRQLFGKTYFAMEAEVWDNVIHAVVKDTGYIREENKKVYFLTDSAEETCVGDFSLQIGDKYYMTPIDKESGFSMKLKSNNTNLTVPAQNFDNCLFFETFYEGSEKLEFELRNSQYFAPGVGTVKAETEYKYIPSDNSLPVSYEYNLVELKYAKINGKEYGKK